MAHDSQIVRANKSLKLGYGWPSQRETSGINKRIKALRQGRHWVWGLTQRRAIKEKTIKHDFNNQACRLECARDTLAYVRGVPNVLKKEIPRLVRMSGISAILSCVRRM